MVQRWVRTAVILSILLGLTVAVALRIRRPGPAGRDGLAREAWPPVPPPVRAYDAWVEPEGSSCPVSHPVKAKLSSRRFHLPGMAAYERTNPDRCYATPEGAEADGLQRAKH